MFNGGASGISVNADPTRERLTRNTNFRSYFSTTPIANARIRGTEFSLTSGQARWMSRNNRRLFSNRV